MSRSLLIISCSGKKSKEPGAIPACQRYTGPPCWVPRRAKRKKYLPKNLDILIISAKHGLLEWEEKIEWYNQEICPGRARELRPSVQKKLETFLNGKYYDQIFNGLWKDYQATLDGFDLEKYCREKVKLEKAEEENRGKKMRRMKKWIIELFEKEQRE